MLKIISKTGLEDLRVQEKEIKKEVEAKKRVADINEELESIMNELGDSKVDKHEDSRRRKKAEIVDHFKRLFPGVNQVKWGRGRPKKVKEHCSCKKGCKTFHCVCYNSRRTCIMCDCRNSENEAAAELVPDPGYVPIPTAPLAGDNIPSSGTAAQAISVLLKDTAILGTSKATVISGSSKVTAIVTSSMMYASVTGPAGVAAATGCGH